MNIYQTLTGLGVNNQQSKSEQKRTRMINVICILWYVAILITNTASMIIKDNYQIPLLVNSCGLLLVICCHLLNYKGRSSLAVFLLMIFSAIHYLMMTCYIAPGRFIEFFFLLIPSTTLILFKKTWQSIIILCFSIAMFHIPFLVFDFYKKEGVLFISPIMIFLFIAVFCIVLYFKLQNEKNEHLLEQEKQKALEDSELILSQKKELERLNDFKNKLFINVSHELRTPITLIDGFASYIIRNKEENPIPHIEKILDQSQKMKVVTDQILDLSKMNFDKFHLNITEVNLTEILRKIHTSFLILFSEKGISFTLDIPDSIFLQADPIYIERAINNIVLNSLKYTENGKVELSVKEENGELLIVISDTGIGIKPADIDKISQEFYQVDNDINQSSGSGIGFSFAKHIIELHNGTLLIKSEWQKGTEITLNMGENYSISHQKEEVLSEPTPNKPVNNKPSSDRPTILIVEDHKEMMNYLTLLLSKEYHILKAENGLIALSILSSQKVDFILTDYMMPKMNGGELIRKIRDNGFETPVIVLTARADMETKLDVLRMGIDDYLHKPFNADELLIRIQNRLINFREKNTLEVPETSLGTSSFIAALSIYIIDNCHQYPFKIEDICLHFGLSESSLLRKVKGETGLTPIAFIKETKLLKARTLIENKEVNSIKELVLSLGLKNKTYFKKQYFERFGSNLNDLID